LEHVHIIPESHPAHKRATNFGGSRTSSNDRPRFIARQNLMVMLLFWDYGYFAPGFLTDAFSGHIRVFAQLNVNDTALICRHWFQYLTFSGFNSLLSHPAGKVSDLLLPALPVAFYIDYHRYGVPYLLTDDQAGDILQGVQSLRLPTDQDAQILAINIHA